MSLLSKPIGKHIIVIIVGVVIILFAADPGVMRRLFPGQRTLTVSGTIDPSLSLTLGSSYLASKDGFGCSNWSLFGGWGPRHTGDSRVARISNGHFEVSIPLPDRSSGRCGYTLQGVSMGLARKGKSPNNWLALFDYSGEMSGKEVAVANPLNAYCTPIGQSQEEWFCSRRPDVQTVLGYRTDRMPAAMTMNIHVQNNVPYEIVL